MRLDRLNSFVRRYDSSSETLRLTGPSRPNPRLPVGAKKAAHARLLAGSGSCPPIAGGVSDVKERGGQLRYAIMLPENRSVTERKKLKFRKGQSGNPGGRPKVLGDVQELARQHAPTVIVELARLALRAKSETARIAAIRELLDRGYGRPRQAMEVSVPADNPLQLLLDEIDARSRIEPPVSHTPDRNQLPRGLNGAE